MPVFNHFTKILSSVGGVGGSADNLGDHIAVQDLNLGGFNVLNPGNLDLRLKNATVVTTNGQIAQIGFRTPVDVSSGTLTINVQSGAIENDRFAVIDTGSASITNKVIIDFGSQLYYGRSGDQQEIDFPREQIEFRFIPALGWTRTE